MPAAQPCERPSKVFPRHNASLLSAASSIYANVTRGLYFDIDEMHFVFNGSSHATVQLRTEVHRDAQRLGQLLPVAKMVPSKSAQGFGMRLCQYIDIAADGIEVLSKKRAKNTLRMDSTVLAKECHPTLRWYESKDAGPGNETHWIPSSNEHCPPAFGPLLSCVSPPALA